MKPKSRPTKAVVHVPDSPKVKIGGSIIKETKKSPNATFNKDLKEEDVISKKNKNKPKEEIMIADSQASGSIIDLAVVALIKDIDLLDAQGVGSKHVSRQAQSKRNKT